MVSIIYLTIENTERSIVLSTIIDRLSEGKFTLIAEIGVNY